MLIAFDLDPSKSLFSQVFRVVNVDYVLFLLDATLILLLRFLLKGFKLGLCQIIEVKLTFIAYQLSIFINKLLRLLPILEIFILLVFVLQHHLLMLILTVRQFIGLRLDETCILILLTIIIAIIVSDLAASIGVVLQLLFTVKLVFDLIYGVL